jgi:hypothetical protein
VILRGYVDDAKDGKTFNLSALVGDGGTWFYLEQDWLHVIEKKNRSVIEQGRKPISRYHATDCQARGKEFKGWGQTEKDEFVIELLSVIYKYRMDVLGYSIDFEQLLEEIPETKSNPEGFAYIVALCFVMLEIGDFTLRREKDAVISLIHDRCDYNAAMLEMFDAMLTDPGFAYRGRFTTLAPMGWEHCIPLQPADLLAYENFKESQRLVHRPQHVMRQSLNAILNHGLMGGRLRGFDRATLRMLRERINSLNPETRERLFANARIKKSATLATNEPPNAK